MQGGLVALDGQHVVGPRGLQVLHDGPLAAGGIDRDDGPLQHHAREQGNLYAEYNRKLEERRDGGFDYGNDSGGGWKHF